jgi:pullulanase
MKPDQILTIHYHRFDETYDGLSLWTWDAAHERTPEQNELRPAGKNDFGVFFELDRSLYGSNSTPQKIGFLPRFNADWSRKDGADKYWTPELGAEVFLIGGKNAVFATRPDTSPCVLGAFIDARNHVAIQLNRLVSIADIHLDAIIITGPDGTRHPVVETNLVVSHPGQTRSFWIGVTTEDKLDLTAGGFTAAVAKFGAPVEILMRGLLDDRELFFDGGVVLGATWMRDATTFRVFAPTAQKAGVVLYDGAEGNAGRAAKGVWEATVPGDLRGRCYVYSFDGSELDPRDEVLDVYATNAVASSTRGRITDLASTNPPAWEKLRHGPALESPVDMVVYEMHVRDFTVAENSGAVNKGLYAGFAEGGTHLPGDPAVATGIDHLVEMGVTHVQLLPVQDFSNNESVRPYNWGYITSAFNSPEGIYAGNLDDDSRIRELKQLIAALHARGIGVILDVVYNHTGEAASFNTTVPGYYFRHTPDGEFSNGSGCGNEFRTEAPMARKFFIESLKFWVREYGVDGFRFDLMALLDRESMLIAERELRGLKPDIVLYGEPWMAAWSPLQTPTDKHGIRGTGIGAFNDSFRNGIKGSPDAERPGWIQCGWDEADVQQGITGTWRDWGNSPAQSVNYLTCHDNLVLYDKLQRSMPGASEAQILAAMRLGYLILFTSQGVPFIHGGEEFARTKGGCHNSYEAPDSINQVDWSLKKKNRALCDYVRQLIALRKAHPLFRLRTKEEVAKRLQFLNGGHHRRIIFTIDGAGLPGEEWPRALVALNTDDKPAEFELPKGRWQFVLEEDGPGARFAGGKLIVRGKAGVVLRGW